MLHSILATKAHLLKQSRNLVDLALDVEVPLEHLAYSVKLLDWLLLAPARARTCFDWVRVQVRGSVESARNPELLEVLENGRLPRLTQRCSGDVNKVEWASVILRELFRADFRIFGVADFDPPWRVTLESAGVEVTLRVCFRSLQIASKAPITWYVVKSREQGTTFSSTVTRGTGCKTFLPFPLVFWAAFFGCDVN